jgi:predicted oxidoreductase
MTNKTYQSDVVVVGGGIAGIITALELLDAGKKVMIIDRDVESEFGGLAKWAFGGMFFVNSDIQKKRKIQDSIDLATKDWFSFAEFEADEYWGREWAKQYINYSTPHGYNWLGEHGIKFFPVVHWVERGLFQQGNSVPRFHLVWGTGLELVRVFKGKLLEHKNRQNLQLYFGHRVNDLIVENGSITGVIGTKEGSVEGFSAKAEIVVVATGGINGSIEKVKQNWYKPWGEPPKTILNGSHKFAIGDLHDATERINGNVVNLEKQWNYAAGIRHHKPRKKDHGLSLVPCKSAIWTNYEGKRFLPMPLVTSYDTRFLVQEVSKQPIKYSWQILNMKIMKKEFAISGSEFNQSIRDKKLFTFLKNILLGNMSLIKEVVDNCEDVIVANSVEDLVRQMNALTGKSHVTVENILNSVTPYDAQIDSGNHTDKQIELIKKAREYRGDKIRTCNLQKILDKKAFPLIAIREFIVSRKSLGGIQTNLECQVLTQPNANGKQTSIDGLYAIGEAAGFGGGGMHGHRSLEGTFLGGCVITARVAAKSITGKTL